MSTTSKNKDSQDFKIPPKFKFQEGEKVLCFHGPLIYEAKCLQSKYDEDDRVVQYHIHYSGWNKSWDEWVPETRVLKYNDANIQKQKDLHKAQKKEQKGKKGKRKSVTGKESPGSHDRDNSDSRSSTPIDRLIVSGRISSSGTPSSSQESSSDIPRKKKPKVDSTVECEEKFLTKLEIKIKLPDELKPILVDDWDFVTKQKRFLIIPSKYTVDSILEDYSKQKQASKPVVSKEEAKIEVTEGIREYFNVMLGTQLLYKAERKQYNEIMRENSDIPASKLYGPVHLLRLFVKIGCALAYTRVDERTVQLLVLHIQDFLKFLHRNIATYFSPQDYAPPVP